MALACMVGCLATSAAAQDASTWQHTRSAVSDQARRELESTDPKDVAWGAFRSTTYALEELRPQIAAALAAPPAADDRSRFAMISALLDAAVQFQILLPATRLSGFRKEWPVQTALLSAHATGERDQWVLDLLSSSMNSEWFASANFLLSRKTAGFASLLLRDLLFSFQPPPPWSMVLSTGPRNVYYSRYVCFREHCWSRVQIPWCPRTPIA